MTKTTDFTPVGVDYPQLVGFPTTATIIVSVDGGKDYEITLSELQGISGWNGTGGAGGTGDAEYEVLASTDPLAGAALIGVPAGISAAAGGATNLLDVLSYIFGESGALFRGDVGEITEAATMPSSAGFVTYYPETGDYAFTSKASVGIEAGSSQGNVVVTSESAYTIGAIDTRVTGDGASPQTFTLPAASVDRSLALPLRIRRSGSGTITVQAPATVTINGALGGSVSLGDRYSSLDFDQIEVGRWECAAAAAPATTDIVAPTVVTFFPADGATNVPIDVVPYVEFSEPVAVGTGTIVIRDNDGGFADLYSYDVATDGGSTAGKFALANTRVTIYPDAALANSTEHAIRIAGTAIDDLAGNSFAGIADDTTWSFTTVAASLSEVTIVTSGSFSVAAGSGNHVENISGLAQNDVLYVAEACDDQIFGGIVAGMAEVYSAVDTWDASLWVGRKVQTAVPDTTITVPRHASLIKAVVWWVVRGANANPDGTATAASGGNNTGYPNSPAYTQGHAGMMPFTVAAQDDHNIDMGAPSGWTLLQSRRNGTAVGNERTSISVAYQAVSATAGTIHDPGLWAGNTLGAWRAITFGEYGA